MGTKFLDTNVLNYAITSLSKQIDMVFLKKTELFNVQKEYYRLFDALTDSPADKLVVVADNVTPASGQIKTSTVRLVTKSPLVYAVGAEIIHIPEVLTPKFDNIVGITNAELTTIKADTKDNRQSSYKSNMLFVVDNSKLVFYNRTSDTFTDCTTGSVTVPEWEINKAYIVEDLVKYNNKTYRCVVAHTSSATTFDDDVSNWIVELDKYYALTKAQYDQMKADGIITNDTSDLYIITDSKGGGGGGSASLTSDLTTNVEVGGIPKNKTYAEGTDIEDIIRDLLVKYIEPTVALAITPNKTVYKKGDTVSTLDIKATVTKNSNDIVDIKYYVDTTLVDTKDSSTDPTLPTGGAFTYQYTTAITVDTTIKITVNDGTKDVTKTVKIEFVSPYYYGASASSTVTATTGLTESAEKKGDKTVKYTANGEYIVFMYPSSYGNLTSILDQNSFENIQDFTLTTSTIDSVSYNIYTTNNVCYCTDFSYTFKL